METHIAPPLPILLVDDEINFLKSASITLRVAGFEVSTCSRSQEVLSLMVQQRFALVLLDVMMPGTPGTALLPEIVKGFPESPVIMLTAINSVETAVECMRSGAFDYLVKPVEKDRLVTSVRRAMDFVEIRNENSRLTRYLLDDRLKRPELFERIVTRNRKMSAIFQYVEAIAQTPMPVLITGETGVGKEMIARIIHDASGRGGEYVSVNIAGLDDAMISDTLFGHEKGAFTGAAAHRDGLVAKASGGTLFLDEIGDLARESQVKLLRLLEDRTYYPVGSDSVRTSSARVIVATNKDMQALRKEGVFRNDLYFRLQSHQIDIPPLRDRKEDIPLLIDTFYEQTTRDLGRTDPVAPPPELYEVLSTYSFPGNIRELKNLVFDALSRDRAGAVSVSYVKDRLDKTPVSPGPDSSAAEQFTKDNLPRWQCLPALKDAEQMLIDEALRRSSGNQTLAAQLLGMTRSALNKRLVRGRQFDSPSDDAQPPS
jgi:DNA-binding NtrC family response regulator